MVCRAVAVHGRVNSCQGLAKSLERLTLLCCSPPSGTPLPAIPCYLAPSSLLLVSSGTPLSSSPSLWHPPPRCSSHLAPLPAACSIRHPSPRVRHCLHYRCQVLMANGGEGVQRWAGGVPEEEGAQQRGCVEVVGGGDLEGAESAWREHRTGWGGELGVKGRSGSEEMAGRVGAYRCGTL